ncbi:MAG: trigger factor [Gammaproteobacteria bacterium]|nr:trigger factor [Gammaproteobacteria bacterium]
MQVSVETTGTLGRRMTVQVPAERIDQEVDNRLKSLARTARISGFRPGKVPFKIVQQRYGQQVHLEVAGDVMSSSLHEALSQQNLRPAGQPKLEPRTVEQGKALEFIAEFEVYPEFEPASVADVQIEKPVVTIGDQDIDAMLDKLRQQRASWETVDRAAAKGDQVNVDFAGTIDGAGFAGGSGQGMTLEIGAGRLIEGFEDRLIGARAGDEVTMDLRFPDDYHSAEVAGKPVQFKVKVNKVLALRLPEVDDAFAKSLGVEGGVDALREEVARNMGRELEQMVTAVVKERAFSQLLERNTIDVPAALVDEEVERLMRESHQQMGGAQGMNLPRSLFEKQAHRRVALGLIIGEIIKRNGIQVDPERVRRLIEGIAASYENPDEVVKWYYENREAMGSAQSLALEEQVVEWLLGQAKVVEKSCTFDELTEIRKTLSA